MLCCKSDWLGFLVAGLEYVLTFWQVGSCNGERGSLTTPSSVILEKKKKKKKKKHKFQIANYERHSC
jgi:hypothetical protein